MVTEATHGLTGEHARAELAELGGSCKRRCWLASEGGEAEDECPVQALVGFPSVLCREPVPVAKSPRPLSTHSSALSALWVRILGKVRF